jgi:non-specific serine/threonine protein kinase/serine/threonine-protein kinase
MASQRERLKDLFGAALELKPEERAAFLDRECSGDAELRDELEALLAAHAGAGSFLEHPTEDIRDGLNSAPKVIIGSYLLLELIGEGGMGEVWLAEQKQPVRRRAAIKLIKAGMDTREVVARFESERQTLALMDHPAIAKVFDGGSTPGGRPYFVMEYVPGIPITTYCDKHKLTIRQRMELFIHVCEGVQHAHQKAIIHRDLKPSNILVAEIDGRPMPRIIDFGVAKATSQKLTAETMYTRIGAMVGTLGYMSPEQADPLTKDIDTRVDVYSLGAVLYELLTSALPLDLKGLAYDEVLRRLRDHDATRPSTKVTALGEQSAVAAKNRSSDPPTLIRQLRGDADAIALKALEKDRTRRYPLASELAADIERYLRHEPIAAHPPSFSYRARKYLRRNRLAVAVSAMAVITLALLISWLRKPSAVPVVEGVTQLTDDGNPKILENPVVSDGSRIYFGEMHGSREIVAQVASTGGQTGVIDTGIEAPLLMDLAPDSSSLLIGDEHHHPGLYLLRLPAGEHRRLSGFEQFWRGCFAPGGGFYLANNRSLYAGDPEGTQVRKFVDFSNVVLPYRCTASPDGTSIRVSVFVGPFKKALWDVSSDGRSAHPFLPGWQSGADTCCGRWTTDGTYFVFQSRVQGRSDLWITRERRVSFEPASSPMRLTNGPLSYEQPFPTRDGKHIYALGLKKRGELVRYDNKSGQFAPYLSGISAIDATVSKNGTWIAYVSFPDHNLWRVRADGSERLQLTYPPTSVYVPRISPDGTKVAYTDVNSGAIFVVSMDAGVPRKVEDTGIGATWSPDSNSLLLFGSEPSDPSKRMETIDLSTGKVSVIPDCAEKWAPFWPSENLIVAAATWNGAWSFVTLDLKTKKWSHLVSAPFNHFMQSVDGKYLYYTTAGDDPKIFRVRFSDGQVEEIASLKNFRPVEDENIGSWVGVTADGDPLLTRDIGTQEIYDLSVRWP